MPSDDPRTHYRPATLAVALGRPPREADQPLNQPLVPASTYVGAPTPHRADGQPDWMGYGRYGNPGWAALEEAVGALEGGSALAFGSGMAAAAAVFGSLPPDAVVVMPQHLYLGVAGLAAEQAQRTGLQVRTVDIADTAAVLAAADGADLLWLETPSNPTMEVADLPAIVSGRPEGCLVLVDNTFATPLLQQPLALGADLVLHSATKFLSGHSDAVCGIVIFGSHQDQLRQSVEAFRRLHGAIPGTLETYLVLRGLRTLPLRLQQAQANAQQLAAMLADHPLVQRVRYPGLPDDPFHQRAQEQLVGFGSMLSIEFADAATADRFIASLQLWVPATSLGGVESTLERRRRWPGELPSIPEGLVRMSVGIEHVDDLAADLRQALQRAAG